MRADTKKSWPVVRRTTLGVGAISTFVNEVVRTPSGQTMNRQFLTHPGAVAVVAWDEVEDTILVLRQYRHPVGMELVEVPAGLLDVEGEDYLVAAQRELAEEAEVAAGRWDVLVDIFTTPGACEESLRVFLARDLSPAPRPAGFAPEDEEAEMSVHLVAREDLVKAILAGDCQSPPLVSGVMALEVARLRGQLDSLRPSDAPWRARE
ncbi:NUDIX domain-containing protein [Actinomyces minihominis]|uniref:NUDIX domain-containing protein n=1 Tax=Actinomyces minihominis TaxID=2002838 RepID=UPI000C08D68A|nr:NUDIX hydrolase [Actinomyces minihominis]